jgi:hypothetical protein
VHVLTCRGGGSSERRGRKGVRCMPGGARAERMVVAAENYGQLICVEFEVLAGQGRDGIVFQG